MILVKNIFYLKISFINSFDVFLLMLIYAAVHIYYCTLYFTIRERICDALLRSAMGKKDVKVYSIRSCVGVSGGRRERNFGRTRRENSMIQISPSCGNQFPLTKSQHSQRGLQVRGSEIQNVETQQKESTEIKGGSQEKTRCCITRSC